MAITLRTYDGQADYDRISAFLTRHYQPHNADGNYVAPAWEYMHYHPALDPATLGRIGIWEDDGEIVAVAHCEWRLGEAFFEFHPAYRYLRREMLAYAEAHLAHPSEDGSRRALQAYVNDSDGEFLSLLRERGYGRLPQEDRPMSEFAIPDPFPAPKVPEGYAVLSLADAPDWARVHRALWRGFNHEGEPEGGAEALEERRKMFDTPTARRDLKIVVQAPPRPGQEQGDFVAFCGMFYDAAGRFGYVEPVATDPDFRRMGLGRAAVLEGIRRCAALGATVAYVGSDQPFYLAIGFRKLYTTECWVREWDAA